MNDSKKRIPSSQIDNWNCEGLTGATAISLKLDYPVHAADVDKSYGPFICPECFSDVVVRKCTLKSDHFAHKARYSNTFESKESELHRSCKHEILSSLKKAFPNGNWETERAIKENLKLGLPKIIPDISGRIPSNIPEFRKKGIAVAIEVQRSYLTVPNILSRTRNYAKRGIYVIWLVPLKSPLGEDLFRPRVFERLLFEMYHGRIYYWTQGMGSKVLPVHLKKAEREIPLKSWYDKDYQEEVSVGGYWKSYKTLFKPDPGRMVEIAKEFKPVNRDATQLKEIGGELSERKLFIDDQTIWWDDEPFKRYDEQELG